MIQPILFLFCVQNVSKSVHSRISSKVWVQISGFLKYLYKLFLNTCVCFWITCTSQNLYLCLVSIKFHKKINTCTCEILVLYCTKNHTGQKSWEEQLFSGTDQRCKRNENQHMQNERKRILSYHLERKRNNEKTNEISLTNSTNLDKFIQIANHQALLVKGLLRLLYVSYEWTVKCY